MKPLALGLIIAILANAPLAASAQRGGGGGGRPSGGGGGGGGGHAAPASRPAAAPQAQRPPQASAGRPNGGGFAFPNDGGSRPAPQRPAPQRPFGGGQPPNGGGQRPSGGGQRPNGNGNSNSNNNIVINNNHGNQGNGNGNRPGGGNGYYGNGHGGGYYGRPPGNRPPTVIVTPGYRPGPAWGWNRGVIWAPVPTYWGGGFWGSLAIAATSAAIFGSIVSSNQTYTSYQIAPNSPGATLLMNYQLTQVPCGPPGLVQIYGPDDSVICAQANNLVAPGDYGIDPSQLTLVSM